MSSHRVDDEWSTNDSIDGLIRCALYDSVAGEEPSPQVWERIQGHATEEREQVALHLRIQRGMRSRRSWFAWLIGAGATFPVPADPRLAWQRRMDTYDARPPQSIVRLAECSMPVLRLVA
jgi:hypothetical protein